MKRRQLSGPTAPLDGRGIHSGEPSRVRVLPAPPGSGLRFSRVDLDGRPELGREDLVRDAAEGGRTTLRRGEAAVQTVEHVAAAVWGMGIDDAVVEIEGPEPPSVDGSALPYVQALQAAGIEETDEERPLLRPRTPIHVEEGGAAVTCLPSASGTTFRYVLDYPNQPLAQGCREISITPESFASEIAPARTFCPADQVDRMLALGWGKGADTGNTLVLDGQTVRDNQLRFTDEPVRHKLLDMVGDLAFMGGGLVASVHASRSGHCLNRKMLDRILAVCELGGGGQDMQDINRILELLPHRYPFLLVDRVLEFEHSKRIVGLKNLTINEPFFQGHFPQVPLMPGVLQIEAMAQLGGMLIGEDLAGKIPVLAAVDKVKFRRGVVPGDQLVMEMFLDRLRSNFGQVHGCGRVDGELACEATIRFGIVPADMLTGQSSPKS